jgi:hypothetical protein
MLRMIVGIVLCLLAAVWIAQGLGWVGGSGMSGKLQWTYIGLVVLAVGVGLIVWAIRWRTPRDDARSAG